MRQWCGVTVTPPTRSITRAAATSALLCPTSFILRAGGRRTLYFGGLQVMTAMRSGMSSMCLL